MITQNIASFVSKLKIFSLMIICLMLYVTTAIADGTHGTKFKVCNNTDTSTPTNITIEVYNGNDSGCALIPHKVRDNVQRGTCTSSYLKCHGKGKHRCFIRVLDRSDSYNWTECQRAKGRGKCFVDNVYGSLSTICYDKHGNVTSN